MNETVQTTSSSRWIDLREHGKLWARYNPDQRLLEVAKGPLKALFNLQLYDLEEEATTTQDASEMN